MVYLKSKLCGDLVTVFLYSRSNAGVRTDIVFKVRLFSVRNIINDMNEVAVKYHASSFFPVINTDIFLACLIVPEGKKGFRSNLASNFRETPIITQGERKEKVRKKVSA